jgi:hypothetical protein
VVALDARDLGAAQATPAFTLIPCAPIRIALCTARFIARRNEMRCDSWFAMLSATSCAVELRDA